uniref:Subtilisin-like protease SBT4.15 n=1 Tax=Davidia involucrata TaxID=16924 RepID=A0A5B7AN33_DAVIN
MKISKNLPLLVFFNLCLVATLINGSNDQERKPYIVYMGDLPADHNAESITAVNEHNNLLAEAIGDGRIARESKIHSYGRSINGFVARLLPQEASRLLEKDGVVSVFPNTVRKLHTTRSWDFLGMPETMKQRNPKVESNLIMGVLDTGIWPDSPSFNDEGYGPPPPKWKGKCAKGLNFTGCNNKVIGATYFNLDSGPMDELTPVDNDGHGTHTSSTAAGVPVRGASLYGLAKGTARGGVPSARIAMYKVCWGLGCTDMDLLAGFDAAIADGVDIISVSIGGPSKKFFEDPMAIGAFHAMKKGILTSCSAGNEGPVLYTVQNVAPWIMTVAASSLDRQFTTAVKLGNGMKTSGISINTFSPKKQMYPLTNGVLAANLTGKTYGNVSACDSGTLSQNKVKGKIVYCLGSSGQDHTINELGGVGTIMSIDEEADIAFTFAIPATSIKAMDGKKIDQYINSSKTAKAVIYKSTEVKITAPFVASFSSRGPQSITNNILKPDIAAPGLSILAAYSQLTSMTGDVIDNRFTKYNILSGTSMACPHAAAAAAYVKSFHPNWSPAAIKSALMTTAKPMKVEQRDAELGSGSGQINPTEALHPGLIYDISMSSYIRFLCKEGYNSTTIRLLTGGKKQYKCSSFRPAQGADGLNYPSMHIQLENSNSSISAVFYRTVTNVEDGKSVYKAKVQSPEGLSVTVVPNTLSFDGLNQKRSFKVVLKGKFIQDRSWILSALLVWSDSKHTVKSPIVVYKKAF